MWTVRRHSCCFLSSIREIAKLIISACQCIDSVIFLSVFFLYPSFSINQENINCRFTWQHPNHSFHCVWLRIRFFPWWYVFWHAFTCFCRYTFFHLSFSHRIFPLFVFLDDSSSSIGSNKRVEWRGLWQVNIPINERDLFPTFTNREMRS